MDGLQDLRTCFNISPLGVESLGGPTQEVGQSGTFITTIRRVPHLIATCSQDNHEMF